MEKDFEVFKKNRYRKVRCFVCFKIQGKWWIKCCILKEKRTKMKNVASLTGTINTEIYNNTGNKMCDIKERLNQYENSIYRYIRDSEFSTIVFGVFFWCEKVWACGEYIWKKIWICIMPKLCGKNYQTGQIIWWDESDRWYVKKKWTATNRGYNI